LSDSTSNFSVPFVIDGFEPLIKAILMDVSSNPIFISGGAGDNVAPSLVVDIQPVPEPSTLVLFAIGVLASLFSGFGNRGSASLKVKKYLDLGSGELPRELLQTKKYRLPVLHTFPRKGG